MFKILLAAVLLISLGTGYAVYKAFFTPKNPQDLRTVPVTQVKPTPQSSLKSSLSQSEIDSSLNDEIPQDSPPPDAETRMALLENKLSVLQRRIEILEKGGSLTTTSSSNTSSSTSKSPVYVFSLGSGSSTTKQDWTTLENIDITINPDDYPGYKNMVLEVYMKLKDGNGKGFVRLINPTDGLSVIASETTTTAWDYTWVASTEFTLSSGKKTFKFQAKSLSGYEVFVQSARIKVSY